MNTNPVDPIFTACGGEQATAAGCDVTDFALKKWRLWGYVPSKHWPNVVKMSRGKVSYRKLEKLWRAAND